MRTFASGFLASIFLQLLTNERELTLLKMLIYPRVIEILLNLMVERKLMKDFKYSEALAYCFCVSFLVYNYFYEPYNLPASYRRGVDYWYP